MTKKYILSEVMVLGKKYEVNHEFTDHEVEEILALPRVGVGISFKKAYEMRFMENYNGQSLINTTLIRKKLSKYAVERGLFIDFEENELHYLVDEMKH